MKHRTKFEKGLTVLLATVLFASSFSGYSAWADSAEAEAEQYALEAGADLALTADEQAGDIPDPAEDFVSEPEAELGLDNETAPEDSDILIEEDDFGIMEEDEFVDEAYGIQYEDADEDEEFIDEAAEVKADDDGRIGTVLIKTGSFSTKETYKGSLRTVTYYIYAYMFKTEAGEETVTFNYLWSKFRQLYTCYI